MTDEERDLIARFIARVGGQPQTQGGGFGSSVPATTQAALPPIDPEADRFIGDNLTRYPEARYRITQMAVVQEAALAEAQNRIKRLEWELQQAQARLQQQPPQRSGGGLFGGLFGGNRQAPPQQQGYPPQQGYGQQQGYQQGPPPQPAYSPGYQPGMFQRQGSGFLGSALTTAAGVAGGMVAGNALMNMFDGNHGGGGFGGDQGGGGFGGGASPWGADAGGGGGDPFAGQGTDVDPNFGSSDQGGGGFDSGGGGFDSGGGGGDWGGGGGDDSSF